MIQTVKRYWSAKPAMDVRLDPDFDAKLTPDDIMEMQIIDADCNDCRYFKRGVMAKIGGLTKFDGHCLFHDRPTVAWPMQFSGHSCFVHRRSK